MGVRVQIGEGEGQYVDIEPSVSVRDFGDKAKLIEVSGLYLLEGTGPLTWRLRKLV